MLCLVEYNNNTLIFSLYLMFSKRNKIKEVLISCRIVISSSTKKVMNYFLYHFQSLLSKLAVASFNRKTPGRGLGYAKIISHDQLKNSFLSDGGKDCLNIMVELTLHGEDMQTSSEYSIVRKESVDDAIRAVSDNNWDAYQDKMFTDFTLLSKDQKTFSCHRFVLASRSPYMKRMLNSGMKEAMNQKMETKDHDSELLEILLEYMYKGI